MGAIKKIYCSGPNHVLPTDKTARCTSGLSVKDFIKIQTYQYLNKKGAEGLAKISTKFAIIEGLAAHKKSAEIRIKNDQSRYQINLQNQ